MATFLPGQTDQVQPAPLYQPDYNFLGSVMGQRQAQYNQGFAKVKSVYSSLLNSPLTNQQNVQFRDELFRKLDNQLRSVASADLSQASNVSKAKGLFKPLLDDQDLQVDMALTHKTQAELAKAEQYQNSTDPELRRKYSDLSRQDLLGVRQQLAEGKRGDGSLQRIQAQEFTPFEDVAGFLDKRAKDEGFKVVRDSSRGFYLVKTTNGPGTVPLFETWAKQAMGTQFDRQFQVEARVGLERSLRGLQAQAPGLSRDQAQQALAQQYAQTAVRDVQQRLTRSSTDLDAVSTQLAHLKKKSTLSQSQAAQYQQLLAQRDQLQELIKNDEQNRADYENPDKIGVLASTLGSVVTQQLKARTASSWATTHALLTSEEEIRPDQVALTKWSTEFTQGQENFRQGRQLSQAAAFKKADLQLAGQELQLKSAQAQFGMQLEQAKFTDSQQRWQSEQQVREGQLAVNEYAAGIKGYAALNGKSGTGSKANPAAGVSLTGSYTPQSQSLTAADVLHNQRQASYQKMYQSTFSLTNSPLEIFYPDGSARQDIASVASKLMDLREGQAGVRFTPQERKSFEDFTKRFHVAAQLSQNPLHAHELLQVMSAAMGRALPSHMAAGVNAGDYTPTQAKTVIRSVAALTSGAEQEAQLRNRLDKVSALMRDASGQLLPQYTGATQIGVNRQGLPIYDAATVKDAAAKRSLDQAADRQTLNQTRLSGNSYQVDAPETQLLSALAKGNHVLSVREGAGAQLTDVTEAYQAGKATQAASLLSLPASAMQAAIGKTLEMRVDPIRNSSTFVFKVDPKAGYSTPKTGTLRDAHTVEVEVSNDVLQNLQLPARYRQVLEANTPNWSDVGRLVGLDKGKGGKAPAIVRQMGIDFDVAEHNTGAGRQVSLHFKMQNPVPGGPQIPDQFLTVPGSLQDQDVARQVDQALQSGTERFIDWAHQVSTNHHATQPQVPTFTLPQ